MEARTSEARHDDRASLEREVGQSLLLLGLTAAVNGSVLGLGLLAAWTLG